MAPGDKVCVLLACAGGDHWALPQNCLAEILTLPAGDGKPPAQARWRGRDIPVTVVGGRATENTDWGDDNSGTGLVAVIPGLRGGGCEYWGVAILGGGLRLSTLADEAIEDRPELAQDYASAAFTLEGVTYQVPDLKGLQATINAGEAA